MAHLCGGKDGYARLDRSISREKSYNNRVSSPQSEETGHFIRSSVMVHGRKDLSSCWTPCFWHNNVRDGSLAVAVYTFFMSLAVVTYCVYIMTGGDTSQLWLPFFETDLKDTLQGESRVALSATIFSGQQRDCSFLEYDLQVPAVSRCSISPSCRCSPSSC